MDIVRQLCEASTNLVKVFPHEDRPVRIGCVPVVGPAVLTLFLPLASQAALRQIVSKLSAEVRLPSCLRARRHHTTLSVLRPCQIESRPAHCSLYFPMGRETAQVVRLVADETLLLNSREKAPFLLLAEVRHL